MEFSDVVAVVEEKLGPVWFLGGELNGLEAIRAKNCIPPFATR
jgi:hypothetical protein